MSLFRNLLIEKKRRKYYCEVEYLESTGTQYIDTGYKLSAGKIMTFNGNIMYTQSNGNANFFYGYRSVDSAEYRGDMRAFFVYGTSAPPAGRLAIRYGVNADNSTSTISQNQKYNISFDGTNLKVDGTTFINLSEAYTPAVYKSMWLFNCNCTGYYSADVAKFSGRIYNWQIFEDGVLVRDMIPVLDWDMTPCMYDKVTEQLFYNQGTGDFVAGHQIHPVEYIESTGTQYINTGIKLNNNSSVELDYQLTEAVQNRKGLFGGLGSGGSKRFGALLSPSNSQLESGYGSANEFYQLGLPDTNRHVIKQEKNLLYFDGSLVYTFDTATFTHDFNAPLGNFNYTNYNPASAKYYRSKWWDNGVLVRDYIPAIDENGICFWFDRVSHTCYLNQGTGAFKYPAREVEYLQSSGTQYIDTGWSPVSNDLRVNFRTKSMSSPSATAICGAENRDVVPRWVFIMYGQSADATKTYPFTGDWNNNDKGFTFTSGSVLEIDWTTSSTSTTITDSVSGTTYTQTFGRTINYSNNPITLKLFQNADNQKSSIQINYYKIWDGGVLIRDFIPCYKDGALGMWDKANNVFYSNSGTGTFTTSKIVEPEYE